MKIWLFLILFIILMIILKMYVSRGIFEVTSSHYLRIGYSIFSISTLLVGVSILAVVFPKGIKDMSLTHNFLIALMVSFIVCELILSAFFLVDDGFNFTKNYIQTAEIKNDASFHAEDRRKFIKAIGLAITSIPFGYFLYGITKGKYNFKVNHIELSFADLPIAFDGFRIVQFSDLHAGGFDSYEDVKKGFELIQQQNPDLILFTGDLVNDIAEEILPYLSLLKELQAPYGKYSILGNHDYSEDDGLFPTPESKTINSKAIQKYQEDAGFTLLNNDNTKIEKSGSYIRLLGVENWGNGFIKTGNLDAALKNCHEHEFSILMSHDPTHWEKIVSQHSKHIHLTLSGHTHGMQMGIDTTSIKWSPIQYLYKYWAGLYETSQRYLYVNRGFGFMAFAGRVGVYPEITTILLKTANKNEL